MRSLRGNVRAAMHWAYFIFPGIIITVFGGILIGYTPHNINLGIALYVVSGTASLVPAAPAIPVTASIASILVAVATFVAFILLVFVFHG